MRSLRKHVFYVEIEVVDITYNEYEKENNYPLAQSGRVLFIFSAKGRTPKQRFNQNSVWILLLFEICLYAMILKTLELYSYLLTDTKSE